VRLVKKLFRPIYRAFFERPIWWFLGKVKAFFFAETLARLDQMERQVAELAGRQQDWTVIEQRLHAVEASNAAQWDSIERLILALFQQPGLRTFDSVEEAEVQVMSATSEVNGINGPHNVH
jgi:hypothetical protein